jgi:transposase, IS6 family
VIAVAVRWNLSYGLSYRDVEELLDERGVTVDHVSVYRRVPAHHSGVHRRCPTVPAHPG